MLDINWYEYVKATVNIVVLPSHMSSKRKFNKFTRAIIRHESSQEGCNTIKVK